MVVSLDVPCFLGPKIGVQRACLTTEGAEYWYLSGPTVRDGV